MSQQNEFTVERFTRHRHLAGYMMHLKTNKFDEFAVRQFMGNAPPLHGLFDHRWWLSMIPEPYQHTATKIVARAHARAPVGPDLAASREAFIVALIDEIRASWESHELKLVEPERQRGRGPYRR